ncbi:hypothetical protein JTE88_03045 [Arcanobacterium phocisimile]|uniref:Uncharacterized protein n=1 Tax=Arcanobacterium phocisimile TaxID=1302235 RepID=A0ABX7IJW8_9ACTO|nr:hypothetical protein [Arcanobacterium phocisimile]QRV02729.1 hypothetical protein JTE88_03045 [Arcanobacterium phocisimile]
MSQYLRNEAVASSSIFTFVGVWRFLTMDTGNNSMFVSEFIVWLLILVGLLAHVAAHSGAKLSRSIAVIGVVILAVACGVAWGSVILAWSTTFAGAEFNVPGEYLVLAGLSMVLAVQWLYRYLRLLRKDTEHSRVR